MMAGLRQWLLGVVLTALAGALARQLTGDGKHTAMVRLAAGLLLTLAVLRPLASLRWEAGGGFPLPEQTAARKADLQKTSQEALAAVIEEKTAAYIWDKADGLGLDCQVQVTTAAGESGIPLPDAVTVTGPYSAELAQCIEKEVGIPPEKQTWLEVTTWREAKEPGG